MDRIRQILGEPRFRADGDEPWLAFERSVGTRLPPGFETFVLAYGPGLINTTLYIRHPTLGNPTLITSTLEQIEAYASYSPSSDLTCRVGTSPGELIPFAHMMNGIDLFFTIGGRGELDWPVCAYDPVDDDVTDFSWGFTEWLVRYLENDDRCSWLSGWGPQEPKTFTDAWAG